MRVGAVAHVHRVFGAAAVRCTCRGIGPTDPRCAEDVGDDRPIGVRHDRGGSGGRRVPIAGVRQQRLGPHGQTQHRPQQRRDEAAQRMIQRCEGLAQDPPGAGWDGVWTLKDK